MPPKQKPAILAPATPTKGLQFRLDLDGGFAWSNISIGEVNRRSFYVSRDGHRTRHLLTEWDTWLRDLCAKGVLIHNGQPVRVNGLAAAATFAPTREHRAVLQSRMQSARAVLKTYTLVHSPAVDERWSFAVTGGTRPYTVTAHPLWSEPPSCDCADATRRRSPWCKHSLAVLMSRPELRCQLLDILLENP